MTGELGSFAHRTMTTRIPAILKQILADHAGLYPPAIVQALEALLEELVSNHPLRPLETMAPDGPTWQAAWQPYEGRGWLNLPWYFAESFFYRRLVEATHYFGGHGEDLAAWVGVDPFLPRKEAELRDAIPWQVLSLALEHTAQLSSLEAAFRALLHHCVWGNRIDLSYHQVLEATGRAIAIEHEQANLLVDDTEQVLAHLKPRPGARRIDFICDNTGTELLLDFALVDFLLQNEWAGQVSLHLKAHPTFVSDAMPADVLTAIEALKAQPSPELQALGQRLEAYFQIGRLSLEAHFFWNSSHFFWELPPELAARLSQAHCVIIKGDANYRRLLGDSRWLPTVPAQNAVPYFPTSFVALRTMKSDPVVGLKPGQAEALAQEDPNWRVNGKRGMIQAVLKRGLEEIQEPGN
jgi:hypothetical protein